MDGVAAVQARIAQIQQLISGTMTGIESGTGASSGTSSSADTGASPEFASLLADALASSATSDPLSDSSSGGSNSLGGSSFLSQLSQLSQLGSSAGLTGATGATGSNGTRGIPGLGSLAGLTGVTALPATLGSTSTGINPVRQQFLTTALEQQGKPYVYGATASITDPNPKAFDCSELTKWAAARVGVTIPDGATAQYLYIRDHGATMTVQQALHTPGALLFHFGHEPRDLGDIPADGHVAISLGDGVHTIEARGHAYGTNVFDNAGGRDFNFAGMIPGMA